MQITFSQKLKELRLENGLDQKELAAHLNVSKSTISAWEIGRNQPNYEILSQIAYLFDVTVDELIGLEATDKTIRTAPLKTPVLTTDEREVIELYRSIGPHEREKVRTALEVYAEATELDQRSGNKNTRG